MNVLIEELDFIVNGNPYHDEYGRFASGPGGASISADGTGYVDLKNDPEFIEMSVMQKHGWKKNEDGNYVAPAITKTTFKKKRGDEVVYNNAKSHLQNGDYYSRGSDNGPGDKGDGYGIYVSTNKNLEIFKGNSDVATLVVNKKDFIDYGKLQDIRDKENISREISDTVLAASKGYAGFRRDHKGQDELEVEYGIIDVSKVKFYEDLNSKNRLSSIIINELDFVLNGNPYHAEDGKFTEGGKAVIITFSVKNYSKEKLNSVLRKYNVSTDKPVGIAINNAAYDKNDYKSLEKEMIEKYGKDWYDNDAVETDKSYLAYQERRAKRIESLQNKINKELGVVVDRDSHFIRKDTYDKIQSALKSGKLKDFINGDTLAAKEDPNFVREITHAVSFYKQQGFNYETGKYDISVINRASDNGYTKVQRDDYSQKSYNELMNSKMIRVKDNEVREWISVLKTNSVYPPITRGEEKSLQEYGLVSAVNQQLREGKSSRTSKNIQSAINKTYSSSQEVYRGVRGDFANQISSLKKGDTITDKGFMSTSTEIGDEKSGAAKFGSTIMKIKTQDGFGKSIDMSSYVRDDRYFSESEILLQSNTTIKYTGKSTTQKDGSGNTITIYEFEAI